MSNIAICRHDVGLLSPYITFVTVCTISCKELCVTQWFVYRVHLVGLVPRINSDWFPKRL
jgi:hypothetical protein